MKNNLYTSTIVLIGISFILTGCLDSDIEVDIPYCVELKIESIKKEDVRNPPAQVWKWKVDGKEYYYITSDCCDQYNYLYDEQCNIVCAPDGGITGNGSGYCPDFKGEIEKILIWKDSRK